jgi:NAD(P)H-hydrate epimerase
MHVLTTAEMREADRRTIEDIGIPGRVLMESAGRTILRQMEKAIPNLRRRPIEIVCGKGNNGGDGLVVFRYFATHGYRARAWVLAPLDSLGGDAKANLDSALELGLAVESISNESELEEAVGSFSAHAVVVDAILGTGLTKAARGIAEQAIRHLNRIPAFRVAVDVPSGLSSDSGEIPGEAIEADLTVALAAPKLCHLLPPACFRCGQLKVTDIGIPKQILTAMGSKLATIEPEYLREVWTPRRPDAHKGSFGHLLIVSGSVGKTGAAVMAASAALRSGVGLVTVAAPRSALPMMTPALLESMWEPLEETPNGAIAVGALPRALELLDGKTAAALGPGLGQHPETVSFVKKLVQEIEIPAVIDADGINAFEGDSKSIPPGRRLALTPHPGEAARLLGCATKDIQRDRLDATRRLASELDTSVALKGFRTLVGEPSGSAHINLTGNAGMASGGTGDVLTGIVGAFLAQGLAVGDSLRLGVYLHGLSGDLAAEDKGQVSLTATDLIHQLPAAIRQLDKC